MSPLPRTYLILFFVAVVFTGVSGCIVSGLNSPNSGGLPADKYVAIYQEYNEQGVVIEGNGTLIATPDRGLAPFDYDGSKGLSDQYSGVTGDFRIFTGIYYYYATPASGRTASCYGGFSGQYPLHLVANLTIHGIDKDGTINASHGDQPVILRIGDNWQSPVRTRVVSQTFEMDENGTVVSSETFMPFKVRYNSTWTVENKGMFNKSKIDKSD